MEVIEKKSQDQATGYKSIYYPPGGILLWIIIFLELITFGLGLMAIVYYGRLEPELFQLSRQQLNAGIGMVNTLFLLTSGYMMAMAVHRFREGQFQKSVKYIQLTLVGGGLFVALKGYEYFEKLSGGIDMEGNMFFTLYWLLTGFHLVHVLVGMVILGWMLFKMKAVYADITLTDLEAGGAFWHMCDLIWLLLFPALYLIF